MMDVSKADGIELILFTCVGLLLGVSFSCPSTLTSAFLGFAFALLLSFCFLARPGGRSIPRNASLWLAGFIAHAIVFSFMPGAIQAFSLFSAPVSTLLWALFCLVFSLQFVMLNLLYAGLVKVDVLRKSCLALPLAWLSAEMLYPKMVPWVLGHSQLANRVLAQNADLFGPELLSLLLLWWSGILITVLLGKPRGERLEFRTAVVAILSFCSCFSYGFWRVNEFEARTSKVPGITLALVQGNLDPFHDFVPEKVRTNIGKYQSLTKSVLTQGDVDLAIWAETSYGWNILPNERLIPRNSERDPLPGLDTPLIVGGQIKFPVPRSGFGYYNSSILFQPTGEISVYSKERLVPFTEYLPFEKYLAWLPDAAGKQYAYHSGTNQRALRLKIRGSADETPVAVNICYEDMWPSGFRKMVSAEGARLLIGMSNDVWFGRSNASEQHQLVAAWNAILFRRYLIRVTNNGVTSVVNPLGTTIQELPKYQEGVLRAEGISLLDDRTLFSYAGHAPLFTLASLCVLLALFQIELPRALGSKRR